MKVYLCAYSCCPGRSSELGYGWNYLLQYARTCKQVLLVTTPHHSAQIVQGLGKLKVQNVTIKVVRLPLALDNLRNFPIGGIHLHYFLWLIGVWYMNRSLKKNFDFAHHATFGSLQFGSALFNLGVPFVFGPVGGGQKANPVFYKLMGRYKYLEYLREVVTFIFFRINPLFRQTMAKASIIYCSNNETLRLVQRFTRGRATPVLKLMLDTAITNHFLENKVPVVPKKLFSILWIGRLLPRKGIEIVLNAVSLMNKEEFVLNVVGDGPLRNKVADYVTQRRLNENVNLVGAVPYSEVQQYYAEADVLVFCSYRESVGIQILEALGSGLPVIAFDQSGASLLLNDEVGIKIPVQGSLERMEHSIAEAIKRLMIDKEGLTRMRSASERIAAYYTWENKISEIVDDVRPFISTNSIS